MSKRLADGIVVALVLLWGTALFAGVAVLQRPLFEREVLALARPLSGLVVAAGMVGAGAGLGWLLVGWLALPATLAERWLVATLAGLGFIGLGWLTGGLLWLPPAWLTAGLLALPLLALARLRPPLPALPPLPRPFLALAGAMLTMALLQALEPATSFDALLYHLRLPELWLATGSLLQAQKAAPFFFPVLVEALYTPAFQLGGEVAPQVLHWAYFVLVLGLLWCLTRRFLPTVSAPLVLALALTIQMLPLLAGWAYVDIPLAAYQVGTFWALLHWREEPRSRWLLVAALFTGLAIGIKYLSVITPVMAGLFILAERRRAALRPLLLFGLIVALVGSPTYVRNLIGTGNPFFPFALPSPHWDEFRAAWYAAAGTGIGWSLPTLLAVPWLATLGIRDTSFYDGRIGPLLTTFLPLALWFWLRGAGVGTERRVVATLGWLASGYLVLWLLGIVSSAALWQGRFLVTPLLLLCPVAAWGIGQMAQLATPSFSPAALAYLFVGAWAVTATLIAFTELTRTAPLDALVGRPSLAAWREGQLAGYARLVEETQRLPASARLLLLFEPRSYQMPTRTEADTLLYEFSWRLWQAEGNSQQMHEQLCTEGFTHAAIYWRGARFLAESSRANPLPAAEMAQLEQWSHAQHLLWEDESESHALYELRCGR